MLKLSFLAESRIQWLFKDLTQERLLAGVAEGGRFTSLMLLEAVCADAVTVRLREVDLP